MTRRTLVPIALAALAVTMALPPATALNPGTELFVPAAARAAGEEGSFFLTDLYVVNPNPTSVQLGIAWLPRGADNSSPATFNFAVGAEGTLVLEDVLADPIGFGPGDAAVGAFRVTASQPVAVTSRIYDRQSAGGTVRTTGQGFEGVPVGAAVGPATVNGDTTMAPGVRENDRFRSNWYGVNTGLGTLRVRVEVLDPDSGVVLGAKQYAFRPWMPRLHPITDLGPPLPLDDATLRFVVLEGEGVFGVSTLDNETNDPTTFESWWPLASGSAELEGIWYGRIASGGGSLGGIELWVEGESVVRIDAQFPSEKDGCDFFFGLGGDFDAFPFDDLTDGIVFSNGYGSDGSLGDMEWTLTLQRSSAGHLSGSMSGVGSGWTGENDACNGDHPANEVDLGHEPF